MNYKKWHGLIILGITIWIISAAVTCAAESTKTIVDMAGRTRDVPVEITRVYSTSPMGMIYLYCLAPEKLVGVNFPLTEITKKYTVPSFHALPVLGGSFGGKNTMNLEGILKNKTQIVLAIGDIDELSVSQAEKFEQQLGLPVIMVDGHLENIANSYEFLGDLLNVEERARELADFCGKVLNDVRQIVSNIPDNQKVRVYYAEGANGLATDPKGSRHSEVLDLVGGLNVAEAQVTRGYGRTRVSIEQVLKWNPDIIIVCTDNGSTKGGYFDKIFADPSWADITAVKNKEVYEVPYAPFNWFDRPPSTNRIMGAMWLSNLLYPHLFKIDIRRKAKDFYEKFYHVTLTDDDLDEILSDSVRVN